MLSHLRTDTATILQVLNKHRGLSRPLSSSLACYTAYGTRQYQPDPPFIKSDIQMKFICVATKN